MTPAAKTQEGTRAPRKRRLSLRLLLLLTLPLMAFGGYVVCAATLDYRTARQHDDWWARQTSLRKFAWHRVRDIVNRPRAFFLRRGLRPDQPGVESLQLEVKPKDWARLQDDVQGRWGKWTDAELLRAGKSMDVKLKVRGDNSVHWIGEKKSLTIKTEKGDHYNGYRRLGLSLKEALTQYVPHLVAPDLDLLSPRAEVLPLFVNGEFFGIFRLIETPDESFLRAQQLLPGNVYRADFAGNGEYFKNLEREVFRTPQLWDRKAENVRPTGPGERGLDSFIQALNGTSFEEHLEFASHFDRDEVSRFVGLLLLFGDPYHMDGTHNQLWYEDPASGLLRPIVWDLRFYAADTPKEERPLNRLLAKVVRDPRIYDGALRAIATWAADPSLLERVIEHLDETYSPYRSEYAIEHLRRGQISAVGDVERLKRTIGWNTDVLVGWSGETDIALQATPGERALVLDLLVGGRIGGDLLGLETELSSTDGARVFCDTDLDGAWSAGDRLVATRAQGGRLEFVEPEPLLTSCQVVFNEFVPTPLAYRLFLVTPAGRDPGLVTPQLTGRGDGAPLDVREWARGETVPETVGFHPWSFERPAPPDVHLSGDVHLHEDLFIAAGAELVLAPGTRLVLDPDVSIEARGRVLARGTAAQPIIVEAADSERPWGTFALQGAGASGSVFEHVQFTGGGGELIGRIEYKGMVCAYHVDDVTFVRCSFADNLRCDDLLNAVLSSVDVRDCEFSDALADAIDFDMTMGAIERCVIQRSGNDGIDLMTCSPRITSTLIEGSGDKGISIGEGSSPFIFDTLIRDCERGIEVKDRSSPLLLDARIEACRTGVLQDRKNWRYAGSGRAGLVGCAVTGNDQDYEGTGGATVTLLDTTLGTGGPASAPPWMRTVHGFGEPLSGSEPPRTWERVPASEVLVALEFEPQFGAPSAGWRAMRGFERVDTLDGDLVGRLRERDGQLSRAVDWDLGDPGFEYTLVVEAAGEDLEEAFLSIDMSGVSIRFPLSIDDDEDTYRYTRRLLVPGHYTGLTLTASPQSKDSGKLKKARLNLQRLTVLRRPAETD